MSSLIKNTIAFILYNIGIKTLEYSKINKKIARNYIAGTHCYVAIMLALVYKYTNNMNIFNMLAHWSSGYFLFDSYFMLRFEKINSIKIGYLYHHLSAMYILHFNPEEYFGDEMIFWGEFSNIPSYFVYHYLHQKSLLISDISKNHDEYLKWFSIQKLLYPIIRIPIVGMLAIKIWKKAPNKTPIKIVMPIYLMGAIWTLKLLKQNPKKIKIY